MTITLTIDSVDSLPDGGPVSYGARNRGFEIGRARHLDWTLPDPSRHISSTHCEVRFENGGYWLYDVSTNGTFLNGSSVRMKSPYRLANGDRLTIGQYIVRVDLEAQGAPDIAPRRPVEFAPPPPPSSGDIWDVGAPAPPPIDRRELMPEAPGRRRDADFSQQFVQLPELGAAPVAAPFPGDPFAPDPPPSRPMPRPVPVAAPEPVPPPPGAFGTPDPMPFGAPVAPVPPVPPPHAAPRADHGGGDAMRRFLEGLAAGAGVSPETFAGRDPREVGQEVGEFMKVTVEQLAHLLRARAAAKAITKSSSRTMISAADNNPLKFIPVPSEVIEVMFTRKRPGFLGSKASLESGFGDLKRHELATFAAMQKALSRLLDEFSPETISDKVGTSAFSSKKSRAWDLFVTRWESKSEPHENGLLDVFFAYFAEAYDEASRKG